jgi:hypothetical protein
MLNKMVIFLSLGLIINFSACSINKATGNDGLDNFPGGYSYVEGTTLRTSSKLTLLLMLRPESKIG